MLKYVPGAQEAYDEEVARHCRSLLNIYFPTMSALFFIPDLYSCSGPFKDRRDVQQGSAQRSIHPEVCSSLVLYSTATKNMA